MFKVDPINERLAPEVEEYIDKWNDPLTWETFESVTAPRIISFTIQARSSESISPEVEVTDRSFVSELDEEGTTRTHTHNGAG